MQVRNARSDDCAAITAIAMRAKGHWGYPASWLEEWRNDLTFTPELLASTVTLVAEQEGQVLGVGCLDQSQSPPELAHLWVDPTSIGRGVGSTLFRALCIHARTAGHRRLVVDSDPNALDFYKKMGCLVVGMTPAPVLGASRELPHLEFILDPQPTD